MLPGIALVVLPHHCYLALDGCENWEFGKLDLSAGASIHG